MIVRIYQPRPVAGFLSNISNARYILTKDMLQTSSFHKQFSSKQLFTQNLEYDCLKFQNRNPFQTMIRQKLRRKCTARAKLERESPRIASNVKSCALVSVYLGELGPRKKEREFHVKLGKKRSTVSRFSNEHTHKTRQVLTREYEDCRVSESASVDYVLQSNLVPIWLGLKAI